MESSGRSAANFVEMFNRLQLADIQERTRYKINSLGQYSKEQVQKIKYLLPEIIVQRESGLRSMEYRGIFWDLCT